MTILCWSNQLLWMQAGELARFEKLGKGHLSISIQKKQTRPATPMKRSAAPANFLVTNSRIREPNRKQVKQPVLVTPRSHPRKSVPKPTTISLEFEKVLHENATRIQKWFRQIKANQKDQLRKLLVEHRKKEPSTRPSRNKKTVPKQQKMVKGDQRRPCSHEETPRARKCSQTCKLLANPGTCEGV